MFLLRQSQNHNQHCFLWHSAENVENVSTKPEKFDFQVSPGNKPAKIFFSLWPSPNRKLFKFFSYFTEVFEFLRIYFHTFFEIGVHIEEKNEKVRFSKHFCWKISSKTLKRSKKTSMSQLRVFDQINRTPKLIENLSTKTDKKAISNQVGKDWYFVSFQWHWWELRVFLGFTHSTKDRTLPDKS